MVRKVLEQTNTEVRTLKGRAPHASSVPADPRFTRWHASQEKKTPRYRAESYAVATLRSSYRRTFKYVEV